MLRFLVADSVLSLNFPKGTKGLTCPAGINMLRFLVADSVLSLNFPKGTNKPDMPSGDKHVTVPYNRIPFCCWTKITNPCGGTDMLYNVIYAYARYIAMNTYVFVHVPCDRMRSVTK